MRRGGAGGDVPGADGARRDACSSSATRSIARNGGFGDAPKFPRPSELLFLLREHARTGDADAREMVLRTLRAMALGGMRDHIGGGFHRYSVDARLAGAALREDALRPGAARAGAISKRRRCPAIRSIAEVAEDTLRYVMREMTDAGGGFYSAEDADSVPPEQAGAAGRAQDRKARSTSGAPTRSTRCSATTRAIVKLRFGIEPDGNAPQDPQQEFTGKNLLYVARSIDEIAKATGTAADEVVDALDARAADACSRRALARPRPHLDDKVLTAWNGLMIAAFARAGARAARARRRRRAPGTVSRRGAPRRRVHPRAAVERRRRGTLLRRYRDGHAGDRRLRRGLRLSDLRAARAVSGRPAIPRGSSGRSTLQRRQDELFWDDAGRRLVQHHRARSERAAADERGLRRRRADGELGVGVNLLTLSHLVDDAGVDRAHRADAAAVRRRGSSRWAARVPMMAAALSTYIAGVQQIVDRIAGDDAGVDGRRTTRSIARSRRTTCRSRSQLRVTPDAAHGARRQPAVHRGDGAGRRQRPPPTSAATSPAVQPVTTVDALEAGTGDHRMTMSVDVWLRGTEHATTQTIEGIPRDAGGVDRRRCAAACSKGCCARWIARSSPGRTPRTIALRGLSWIVNPLRGRRRRDRDRDHAGRGDRRAVRHRQGAARGDDHARARSA